MTELGWSDRPSMDILDPEHVEWCRNLWNSLADGGEWTIPRSGVAFRREGDKLIHIRGKDWDEVARTAMHFAYFGVEVISRFTWAGDEQVVVDGTRRWDLLR